MADERITVLVENTAGGRGLLGEHGLSLWIEIGGRNVLFDAGQGIVVTGNARELGIRLETADAVALSHGHYDHTGGLYDALCSEGRTPLYAHPAAFMRKYARNPDGSARSIGIPAQALQKVHEKAEIVRVEGPVEVFGGLWLTGPVPRTNDFEDTGGGFFKNQECTERDGMEDDQAAFIETPAGTVVILGCAHAGVINTLHYIEALTEGRRINMVMGGMHLVSASDERMDKTVAELSRLKVGRLLPCHCTGLAAVVRLWQEFPGKCAPCHVGTAVKVER